MVSRLPTPEEDAAWTPYGNGHADHGRLQITTGQVDSRGRRKIVAVLGKKVHSHVFDPFDQFQRKQFREALVSKFALSDAAHEHIDAEILALAESSHDALWAPKLISMAEVREQQVRWFWEHCMPEGAFTLLDSDPGEGKSTVMTDISARHTRGDAMPPHTAPNGTYDRGNVLLLCGEDDLQRTIKPRLVAAGADVSRVYFLRTVSIGGEDERIIQLPSDIPIIERVVAENKITFIGIDVLGCFIEPGLSMNDDAAMRKLTTPFANMLERTKCTALVLRHLNKKENLRGMYRGGGSIAIVAAARAAFTIAPHPDEPDVKVLAAIKHNLGPRPHSLTYSIEASGNASRIVWGGQTDLTAADVLKPHGEKPGGGNKTEAAKQIIADVLSDGPRGSNEVEAACTEAGISNRTYWTARKAMGLKAEKTNFAGNWLLSLPSSNGWHAEGCKEDF